MKNIYYLILCTVLLVAKNGLAQVTESAIYHHKTPAIQSTGSSGTGKNLDVIYQRCKWTANPDDDTKTLMGSVTIYFKTIISNVATINFDFNNNSFNNSSLQVYYHNQTTPFDFGMDNNPDVINIKLPTTITQSGTIDSITIQYMGIPPAETDNQIGYQRATDANGNNYIYTLSESYEDKDWFPCKADMQDKIDSLDIIVTCPNAFWVAANGIMTDSTDDGNNRTFVFKHRYPIASYLVAISIAKYKRFYLGNVSSNNQPVPYVVNMFAGKTATEESNILTRMNNNKLVFEQLSNLYGAYPFAKEKHGFYEFGFGGGMEHQTMSGIGTSAMQSNTILAHELGHQWFGDKVTMSSWKDLWLAEGFASYSEALAFEKVPSIGINPVTKMANVKNTARANNATPIAITDITNSSTIWTYENTTAIYERACMVIAQLRCLLGDARFFTALKNYQNDTAIAYKSATTADAQRNFEQVYGESLSSYFNEWIYKRGTPNYTIEWGNNGTSVNIQLTQTISSSGNVGSASTFFPMPVVINIANATNTQDTTIVIYHKAPNQVAYSGNGAGSTMNSNTIQYNLSFVPATLTHDPLNRTFATANIVYNTALPLYSITISSSKTPTHTLINVAIHTNDAVQKVELEKSTDGFHFSAVAAMPAPTVNNQHYQYLVNNAHQQVYYRAKVYTNNGFTYSSTLTLPAEKNIPFTISPNPANHAVQIRFNNSTNEVCTLLIWDARGNRVYTTNTRESSIAVSTTTLSNGMYVVECIKNGISTGKQQMLVQHK